ncbi:hypothetical protein CkaCkLH20_11931 [Colletotrichum karsti]|uniref:Zn(2)-C6 fungal-type domain-containing protein n=1 Tax=Colletotrichum karsti TaxID=1095194 RepID=A0A9P6I2B8_9PEZI|nr:uncharacterized protein CkaCkLH20_11931 [Colletotrichum karsti]KAF9870625.1 hypothetical protein CkaCkLH20_11931 [Colletotrichum karsti]
MGSESVDGRLRDKAARIGQACLRCQSKKIKCDGKQPSCTPCTTRSHDCQYQQVQRRRGPGRSKMYIQALEERLSKMEAVLNQAGLPRPDAPPTRVSPSETDAASVSVAPAPPGFPGTGGAPSRIDSARVDNSFDQMSTDQPMIDVAEPQQAATAVDPSDSSDHPTPKAHAPQHIFEPPRQVAQKMPVFAVIASRMREINSASYCSTFNRQVFTPRLDREEAITMLMPLYDDVIGNYPLLNFHYFVHLFETLPEAEDTFNSTSGWAYMNTVIADVEARSRVFWAAYILDKEMGLNHGLDSIQDDDDIETELPSGPLEGVDILNLRAKLAMVESSIRRRLYTAKGLRLTDDDVIKAIIDLDALLEEWRTSLPIDLQPAYDVPKTGSDIAPDVLNLHLAFYRCALMVHWAARRHSQFKTVAVLLGTPAGFEMPYIQLSFSQKRCRTAAHATLGLFRTISTPQYSDLWTAQYAVDDAQNTMRAQNMVTSNGASVSMIPGFTLNGDAQALQSLLGAATHPMYLIQGLMGNLPNRDQSLTIRLAHLLGTPFEGGKPGSPLGSQPLQPETYGFGFGQGQAGNDPTANWS